MHSSRQIASCCALNISIIFPLLWCTHLSGLKPHYTMPYCAPAPSVCWRWGPWIRQVHRTNNLQVRNHLKKTVPIPGSTLVRDCYDFIPCLRRFLIKKTNWISPWDLQFTRPLHFCSLGYNPRHANSCYSFRWEILGNCIPSKGLLAKSQLHKDRERWKLGRIWPLDPESGASNPIATWGIMRYCVSAVCWRYLPDQPLLVWT